MTSPRPAERLDIDPVTSRRPELSDTELAARAAYVLRGNDRGSLTVAAPGLYPHMWSWDAAFIAIGLARLDIDRAMLEMDTLFSAQWRSGMLPHIVFTGEDDQYFPDADRWGCSDVSADAPSTPRTSGICQPPVHALAVDRIVTIARSGSSADRRSAEDFLSRSWPRLMAWHRWMALRRDPDGVGRVAIYHGWESGMDNSPRWDAPYSRVAVGADLPPYTRRDLHSVTDASQRPTDVDYDRYLWLVEQMRQVGYDDGRERQAMSFAVEDVFMSGMLSIACDDLADLGEGIGQSRTDVHELRGMADRFRRGVVESVDPRTGLARDRDLRTGEWLRTDTIAAFTPLLSGGLDVAEEQRLFATMDSPAWTGNPDLRVPVLPSTSPSSPTFQPRQYWRGPQWPVMAWFFSLAFRRRGMHDRADRAREDGLALIRDGTFGEYYEPFTGEPLGSRHQSWTAAAALDWLC